MDFYWDGAFMPLTKLKVPQGDYDLVASIGKKCQPAGRLKRLGLRTSSGPFDWFASQKLSEVTKIFSDGIDHLFLPANIQINGTHKDCMDITDTSTGYRSIHDLLIDDCKSGVSEAIAAMKEKIAVRLARFIKDIENADRVLLVRLNANRSGVVTLRRFLNKRFPNTTIDILVINEARGKLIKNEDYGIPNTYVLTGDNSASGEGWLGNDQLWHAALSGIKHKSEITLTTLQTQPNWKTFIQRLFNWKQAI
jgi:hypothetical protein